MANDYYNNTTNPPFQSAATSASVRNQLAAITAGFDLLPATAALYDGKVSWGTCTGSSNAYVLSTAKGITALSAGVRVAFLPNHANSGAATINVDGKGVKSIKTVDGLALTAGDLMTTTPVFLVYNGTDFVQLAGSHNVTKAYINAAAAAGGPPGDINFQQLGIGVATPYDQVQVNSAGTALEAVALTPDRVMVTDANGGMASSAVTVTELDYLSGATSSIQSQLTALVAGDKMPYVVRTSDTVWAAADQGKYFYCTGTWTQTITAAATLGDGWWCIVRNAGTGIITLDADSVETIDGNLTCPILPKEERLVICTGGEMVTAVLRPFYIEFTATGANTFTKPLSGYSRIGGLLWAAGGGGARGIHAAGGGGGFCLPLSVNPSDLNTSATITLGAGGAGGATSPSNGSVGGNSTIALITKTVTAYGGSAGTASGGTGADGGGGGGAHSVGTTPRGGQPRVAPSQFETGNPGYGGGDGYGVAVDAGPQSSVYGGGGGGGVTAGGASAPGGASVYGGGGGGANIASQAGGVSTLGGNGGAGNGVGGGVAGTAPAGGGGGGTGAAGGAGGDGKCILWGIV